MVFSPIHCVLAGDAEACRQVLAGCRGLTAVPSLGLAAHTPVMAQVQDLWYRHHHRPARPVPGVVFHSSHFAGPFELTPDRIAESLTGQMQVPQDFPAAAWRAWDSGVRVFIEHGPRNLLSSALRRMLPRDEGLFLAMDVQGENALMRAVKVALELWCRGVPADLGHLEAALGHSSTPQPCADPLLDVAASLFAASLERMDSLQGAFQACLQDTRGRFLEFLGQAPEEELDL
jgi:acyl transferase domain-containing protein